MPDNTSVLLMSFQLVLAGVLGGIVGYERETHDRPAGLRTHVLVCLGAALMTLVSISFDFGIVRGDPARVAAQIVSGIGFLGAGTIMRRGSIVRGLTTAASLWTVAGIGMAVGIGGQFIVLAVIATGVVFLTLSFLRRLELTHGKAAYFIYVEADKDKPETMGLIISGLAGVGAKVNKVNSVESGNPMTTAYRISVSVEDKTCNEQIVKLFCDMPGLSKFELE